MRMYVHGSGRVGRAAWPGAPTAHSVFPVYDPHAAPTAWAEALTGDVDVVVAHSWGAIPTLHACALGTLRSRSMVLVEPALYDLARGAAAVERHIALMSDARAIAQRGDLFGFWSRVRPVFFGGPAEEQRWHDEEDLAASFAEAPPPWGHAPTAPRIPTVVVTGAWNDKYEEIAQAMTLLGATHVTLAGHGQRPQDHPDFERLLVSFTAAAQ